MIRNIPIPKTVSRVGCTPGGGCCDECGGHGAQALGRLGDTACDSDGNCYDTTTGTLLSAPLTTGPGCAPGVASCAASGSLASAALGTYLPAIIIGSVAALLLFTKGGK